MKKWIVLLGGGMFCVLFLSMYFVVDQLGRMPTSEEIRNVEVPAKLVSFRIFTLSVVLKFASFLV